MKILFISLGCDKNLSDSEKMLGLLAGSGYEITDDETEADVIVINTCAFIHDANTDVRKKELFSKVRRGAVRILMGSTFEMGAGTNVQDRIIASHDLDCPWRPRDLEQRAGRTIRQGNQNP